MKRILWAILLFLIVFWSGVFVARKYFMAKDVIVEDSEIILEQIEKVCKLVTVEGHFVEYYDYKEVRPPSGLGFPFVSLKSYFPQAAQMRVRGTVSVGYDLTDMKVEAFPEEKLIRISKLPDPEILSVDHEVDYFKDDSWLINPLNEADYVRMGKGAEDKIRAAAEESNLKQAAEEQGNEVFDLIEFIVVTSGWTIQWGEMPGTFPELPMPDEVPDSAKAGKDMWNEY
ncbi:MAG: DUF4230 domain-containing protein [Bacteroidetes bacterium]|nr:DUF4230 domain-containing protein [Bacteroidota bacterium]